jgi:hypothetical protein
VLRLLSIIKVATLEETQMCKNDHHRINPSTMSYPNQHMDKQNELADSSSSDNSISGRADIAWTAAHRWDNQS